MKVIAACLPYDLTAPLATMRQISANTPTPRMKAIETVIMDAMIARAERLAMALAGSPSGQGVVRQQRVLPALNRIGAMVRAGLRNARTKGKLGRPRVLVDASRVADLRARGRSPFVPEWVTGMAQTGGRAHEKIDKQADEN